MALNEKNKAQIAAHLANTVAAEEVREAEVKPVTTKAAYPVFDVEEARKGVLSKIEVEEVRKHLEEVWGSGQRVCSRGRKPVGITEDYKRASFVVRRQQVERLKKTAKAFALTEKEMLEYCLQIAFNTLDKYNL